MRKPVKKRKGLPKQQAFLAAYCLTASVTRAAKATEIDRALHYRWLREDADYPRWFDQARKDAGGALVDEAVRRAHSGYLEPVIYKGELTYRELVDPETGEITRSKRPLAIRKYDNKMLRFLIKGFLPEYRDRSVDAQASGAAGLTWEEFVVMYRRTTVVKA